MIFFRRRRDLYYELVVKQLSFQETLETLEHRWEKYIKPMLEDAGGAFILVGNFRENGISSYKKKHPVLDREMYNAKKPYGTRQQRSATIFAVAQCCLSARMVRLPPRRTRKL